MVERVRVDVRLNHERAVLDCPGILVSRIELPLTKEKQEKFARTARRRARKHMEYIAKNGNTNPPPEKIEILDFISRHKGDPTVVFEFVPTLEPRNFDTAGNLI